MKKLLLVTALTILGTTAFAAAPKQDDSVTVPVEVRAKLTDASFSITDIDGKELVLDFGEVGKSTAPDVWTAEVEYKITAKENTAETTFGVKLTDEDVTLVNTNNALKANNTLVANLKLDKDTKVMAAKTQVVTGMISGSIDGKSVATKEIGQYKTTTYLTATVNNVGA